MSSRDDIPDDFSTLIIFSESELESESADCEWLRENNLMMFEGFEECKRSSVKEPLVVVAYHNQQNDFKPRNSSNG